MAKLELKYPVAPFKVTQPFGVNGQYYRDHGINILGHNGLDLEAIHGQSVFAAHDGICYPEVDAQGGNGVVIITETPFDYQAGTCFFKTIFWHLTKDDAVVKTNQHVKTGDLIGYADNTGLSTGDHLHFGLKPVLSNTEAPFAWQTVQPNNGYLGAIDPTPFFETFEPAPVIQSVTPIPQEVINKEFSILTLLKQLLQVANPPINYIKSVVQDIIDRNSKYK